MSYDLIVFKHGERDAFKAAFATLLHSSDELSQERREWWCFDNPHGGAFALIRSGNEIAATCYLGGKRLRDGNNEIACFEIGETATDPAHQRKGLFSKLVKACSIHAEENGRKLVYGTPNSQSTPGYAKLGFTIVENSASWLFVLANPSHWLGFRLPSLSSRAATTELTAEGYREITATYPRRNVSDQAYLRWRFEASPTPYRHFKIATPRGSLVCTVKAGVLGKYPMLVVSEYFLDGVKPSLAFAGKWLRRLLWSHYDARQYMGLYIHAPLPDKADRIFLKARAILPHRQLPICAITTSAEPLPDAWFADFQLSDCDIG
jgi:GNAT superfamily N-acetyltransferase